MEIKVCQQTSVIEGGWPKTHIFEGERITYGNIHYKDKANFNELVQSATIGTVFDLGIPPDWYNSASEKKVELGCFLLITFKGIEDQEYYSLIVKDAIVYITNKGQTIDKIEA